MQSTINERFKDFIEKTGMVPSKFAREIGLNHESINRIMRNPDIEPSISILVASKLRWKLLDVNYILTGEGKMFLSSVDSSIALKEYEEKIKKLEASIDEKDITIGSLAATIRNLSHGQKEKTQDS